MGASILVGYLFDPNDSVWEYHPDVRRDFLARGHSVVSGLRFVLGPTCEHVGFECFGVEVRATAADSSARLTDLALAQAKAKVLDALWSARVYIPGGPEVFLCDRGPLWEAGESEHEPREEEANSETVTDLPAGHVRVLSRNDRRRKRHDRPSRAQE